MMNFLTRLGGWASAFSTGKLKANFGDAIAERFSWISKVFGPISIGLYIIMGIVGVAGAVYAIYVGIQLARADEQGKRDEARKHLITVLIAVAVTIVGVIFFNELLPLIIEAIVLPDIKTTKAATTLVQMAKTFIR